jgi:integrase
MMKTSPFFEQILPFLDISPKTRSNYEGAYRLNLKPFIGEKSLEAVTRGDIVGAIETLPAQTRYQSLMTARVIFREAIARELISVSPAAGIKPPRVSVRPAKFLTWEELEVIDFGSMTTRIKFLALHGLRYGEAAALEEADIYDGLVHITKSKYGPTKSPAGVRNVPLLSDFQPFPLHQRSIAKALAPYDVTVHSLRKTYAYTLKSANIHVTTAAKLMGHSNPMVTLSIYTQVRDDELSSSGLALKAYIGK